MLPLVLICIYYLAYANWGEETKAMRPVNQGDEFRLAWFLT